MVSKHPEYEVTALLRRVPDGFASRYSNVHIVRGDYDTTDVISNAASQANVVVRKSFVGSFALER